MNCARCGKKAEIKIETPEIRDIYNCLFQQYLDICKGCKKEGEKIVE